MTTVIPYFDWPARAADWADDLVEVFQEVAESDEFILKSRVERLEAEIAARTGAAHAVAVASGTGALTVILAALGLGDGDEVVTPAFSFVSTASTVALRGARPVFADVEYETGLLDPAAAEAAVSARTRALLPAYLFSGSPKMGAFAEIAARHSLHLVEDSAIALGAEVDGKPAGRHGHAGVYSFFPAKPAGGIGDAGMIVTDDDDLARTARMLRNHGQPAGKRFYHELLGFNCRMDELTAGFLLRKLPHLDGLLEKRREIAAIYEEGLRPLAPALLPPPAGFEGRSVYTYVVRAQQREELRAQLAGQGIETAVYYPRPLHLQPAFAHLGYGPGDFPVAEQLSREALALPLHPDMAPGAAEQVVAAVSRFYAAGR
ncbi:DegT/DnrJ/EryC1/StrS family aminotransferase [Streptomyces sp. NBC_00385]|uniref:DegT/DnrJ/EryC1/StrS family aminotransferase n=1 Tax=Streptomyces sp. NBC_00385 TaxID=2975733 RepID=UPI002DD98ACD|nr:DegT/DnrJ/EryC1/StrS family aminotransferase [Streptomyces sp. NBC_00385]WRZ05726.1 DegT/DnrJ/EryC1/StrS family aminotransferase [Streptomyces sp. NBC_00385]